MKTKLVGILLVFSLLAVSAIAVAAETGTVTITGGTLSVTAADVTLSGVTLDGTDKLSTSASGANSWSAADASVPGAHGHGLVLPRQCPRPVAMPVR